MKQFIRDLARDETSPWSASRASTMRGWMAGHSIGTAWARHTTRSTVVEWILLVRITFREPRRKSTPKNRLGLRRSGAISQVRPHRSVYSASVVRSESEWGVGNERWARRPAVGIKPVAQPRTPVRQRERPKRSNLQRHRRRCSGSHSHNPRPGICAGDRCPSSIRR
jgi:hypothetical protein